MMRFGIRPLERPPHKEPEMEIDPEEVQLRIDELFGALLAERLARLEQGTEACIPSCLPSHWVS